MVRLHFHLKFWQNPQSCFAVLLMSLEFPAQRFAKLGKGMRSVQFSAALRYVVFLFPHVLESLLLPTLFPRCLLDMCRLIF